MIFLDEHLFKHFEPEHGFIKDALRKIYNNKHKPIIDVSHLRHSVVDKKCREYYDICFRHRIESLSDIRPYLRLVQHSLSYYMWFPYHMVMPLYVRINEIRLHQDLFFAGVWAYGETDDAIVYITVPRIYVDEHGRPHREDGPAIDWLRTSFEDFLRKHPDSHYVWHGTIVPDWIVLNPHKITIEDIIQEPNQEVRRVMIERTDIRRLIKHCGRVRHKDDHGTLWDIQIPQPHNNQHIDPHRWFNISNRGGSVNNFCVVEVVNGTPEPDGTYRTYFLRVPPTMRTATEAVAWTYGLTEKQYKNLVVRT